MVESLISLPRKNIWRCWTPITHEKLSQQVPALVSMLIIRLLLLSVELMHLPPGYLWHTCDLCMLCPIWSLYAALNLPWQEVLLENIALQVIVNTTSPTWSQHLVIWNRPFGDAVCINIANTSMDKEIPTWPFHFLILLRVLQTWTTYCFSV